MTATLEAPEKLVGALVSGIDILRYMIRAREAVGVSQIARDLDLNTSTCFNLLRTLVHEGLLRFDAPTKTYSLGLGIVELAKGAIEQGSYARIVRPHMTTIAQKHRVTTTLWQRSGPDRVVLVELVDGGGAARVHMNIGQRLPIYIAALGRCMAAHTNLPKKELERHFRTLRWEEAPSFKTYVQEVETARREGFAIDNGNFVRGVGTVSSLVTDSREDAVMAISAVGFSAQFSDAGWQALGMDLRRCAREVSQALKGGA